MIAMIDITKRLVGNS